MVKFHPLKLTDGGEARARIVAIEFVCFFLFLSFLFFFFFFLFFFLSTFSIFSRSNAHTHTNNVADRDKFASLDLWITAV